MTSSSRSDGASASLSNCVTSFRDAGPAGSMTSTVSCIWSRAGISSSSKLGTATAISREASLSPIGGITFYRDGSHGSTLDDPVVGAIARAHGKTPAQVMLRSGLQQGRSVIPKSTKPSRIAENIDVFDFALSAEEMAAIDGLDTGRRGGPAPEAITLEAFGREIPEA